MTISLNPLFAGSARQSVPSAEENVAVDAANPFADLLAAQLQVSSLLPTAQAALPREDVATELSLKGRDDSQVDMLALRPQARLGESESFDTKFASHLSDSLGEQQSLVGDDPSAILMAGQGGIPALGAQVLTSLHQANQRANGLQGMTVNLGSDNGLAASVTVDQAILPGARAPSVLDQLASSLEGRSSLIAPVLKEGAGGKLSKVVDAKASSSVKELVSLVAPGQGDKPVKEMLDPKALIAPGRQAGSADVALAGGLKDKGFAVRIEADMALSAAGKDGVVPVALQTAPLTLSGGQGAPTSGDVVIAEPMAKTDAWGEAFGKQLMSNAVAGLEKTTIQVNPEHLGPLEISITMNKEQAQVMVLAANPQARDIVEHHLPALSRMMEQAGLQLADAQVSSQQQGQNQGQEQGRRTAQQHQELVPELNAQVEDLAEEPVSGLRIRA